MALNESQPARGLWATQKTAVPKKAEEKFFSLLIGITAVCSLIPYDLPILYSQVRKVQTVKRYGLWE